MMSTWMYCLWFHLCNARCIFNENPKPPFLQAPSSGLRRSFFEWGHLTQKSCFVNHWVVFRVRAPSLKNHALLVGEPHLVEWWRFWTPGADMTDGSMKIPIIPGVVDWEFIWKHVQHHKMNTNMWYLYFSHFVAPLGRLLQAAKYSHNLWEQFACTF